VIVGVCGRFEREDNVTCLISGMVAEIGPKTPKSGVKKQPHFSNSDNLRPSIIVNFLSAKHRNCLLMLKLSIIRWGYVSLQVHIRSSHTSGLA
jgi:hypothetical protein